MSQSMRASSAAPEDPRLAGLCASDNKGALPPHQPAPTVREAASEAIRASGNTHKAAAIDLELNRSRLSHKLKDGTLTLREMEILGPAFAVKFGAELLDRFAPLATPHARAQQVLREMRRMHDELQQLIDFLGGAA